MAIQSPCREWLSCSKRVHAPECGDRQAIGGRHVELGPKDGQTQCPLRLLRQQGPSLLSACLSDFQVFRSSSEDNLSLCSNTTMPSPTPPTMLLAFLFKILQEQKLQALQGGRGVMGAHVWLWSYLHRGAFLPWITPHPETSSFIPSHTQLGLGEAMTGGPALEVGMGRCGLFPTPQTRQICPL